MRILSTLLAQAIMAIAVLSGAHAACTTPAGNAGEVAYNATYNVMQYCNGTDWIRTGAAIQSAAGTACTNPTGPEGAVVYNAALGVVQFCNGDNWVNTACTTTRSPGGSGCTSPTGAPGAMVYESANKEMQFCDSTNWVAMGWPCAGAATGLLNWAFVQKITSAVSAGFFGEAVDIDNDTMVIGGTREDTPYTDVGAIYVFTRSGGTWSQQAKFQPAGAIANNYAGQIISLDGDTLAVGLYNEAQSGGAYGWAYIFTRSGSTWSQQAKIRANDYTSSGIFGYSIALDTDTALIGDPHFGKSSSSAGAIYVFKRTGSSWAQEAKLAVSDGAPNDKLGYWTSSLDIKGDTAVIGSPARNAVYVFTRSGTTWTQRAKLQPSDGGSTGFGVSVSLHGTTLAIGSSASTGSVYIFTGSGASWTEQAKIVAADSEVGDQFSNSLSLNGENLVIGAYADDDAGSNAGAAYFYKRSGTNWVFQKKVVSTTPVVDGSFGRSVSLSGQTAAIGAYTEASYKGAVYTFSPQSAPPSLFIWNSTSPLPSVQVNNPVNFTPSITYNGDPMNMIMYSITNKPPMLSFNSVSGAVTGTPGSGDAGTYTFTIKADDGSQSSSKAFTLTITP